MERRILKAYGTCRFSTLDLKHCWPRRHQRQLKAQGEDKQEKKKKQWKTDKLSHEQEEEVLTQKRMEPPVDSKTQVERKEDEGLTKEKERIVWRVKMKREG